MSITLNKAICLHAQANDLKFLNPVRNRMAKLLDRSFQGFSFGDQTSQAAARLALEKAEALSLSSSRMAAVIISEVVNMFIE